MHGRNSSSTVWQSSLLIPCCSDYPAIRMTYSAHKLQSVPAPFFRASRAAALSGRPLCAMGAAAVSPAANALPRAIERTSGWFVRPGVTTALVGLPGSNGGNSNQPPSPPIRPNLMPLLRTGHSRGPNTGQYPTPRNHPPPRHWQVCRRCLWTVLPTCRLRQSPIGQRHQAVLSTASKAAECYQRPSGRRCQPFKASLAAPGCQCQPLGVLPRGGSCPAASNLGRLRG